MKWSHRLALVGALAFSAFTGAFSSCGSNRALADATGTVGTNGLWPCAYRTYQGPLTDGLRAPFKEDDSRWKNIELTPQGQAFMKTVFECALQPNDMAINHAGKGLLRDDKIHDTWSRGPLNDDAVRDIHTCVAMHVNLLSNVDFCMDGADFDINKCDEKGFPVLEGHWGATIDKTDRTVKVYYFPPDSISSEPSGGKKLKEIFEPLYARMCSSPDQGYKCPFRVVEGGHCTKPGKGGCGSACNPAAQNDWTCVGGNDDAGLVVPHAVETRLSCESCCCGPFEKTRQCAEQCACTTLAPTCEKNRITPLGSDKCDTPVTPAPPH